MGILLKNENKGDEMVEIMTHLHQYVPTVTFTQEKLISTGEKVVEENAIFHSILVGGDQLTAARSRSAIKAKVNSETPCKRLSGIVPVIEDWHTKANCLGVSQCSNIYQYTCNIKLFSRVFTVNLEVLLQLHIVSRTWHTMPTPKSYQSYKCSIRSNERLQCM